MAEKAKVEVENTSAGDEEVIRPPWLLQDYLRKVGFGKRSVEMNVLLVSIVQAADQEVNNVEEKKKKKKETAEEEEEDDSDDDEEQQG